MPGPQHDAANDLIREHPELVQRLLHTIGHVDLPNGAPLRVDSGELNDRISTNRHADTLILAGPPHDPWYGLISEIETKLSKDKILQALRYAATVWLRLDKPIYVLFITPDPSADLFTAPTKVVAGGLTITLTVCVCGPNQIPAITRPAQVPADPALATLSVMQHGDRMEVSEAFMSGLDSLDPDDAARYYEYAHDMASPTGKRNLEELMATMTWPVYSPFAKEHFGKGKAEGRAEGRTEGRAEGIAEGRVEGKAAAIVSILLNRELDVSAEQRALIEKTKDEARLDSWIRRAISAASTEELLQDE
jgi:hypothetical protein